ncbi:MAG: histidine kinase [Lachnospiraceae bacterium]|nr:histidine kinase [Lachnospiraceae bacterium]
MKNRAYSKLEIKRIMRWFSHLSIGTILILLFCILGPKSTTSIQIGLVIIDIIAIIVFFRLAYYQVYKPSTQLEELIEQYRNSEGLEPVSDSEHYDLINETKEIISSLETIAIKQKNAEILMKVAEINNLQDQINPHFLYNTLEVIRGEAMLKGEKKIAEMTESLANYFRYNISRKETFVSLQDELKNIKNYFTIQKNRFGKKISCEVLYDDVEQAEVEHCYIPKLILQPIIENCIYHGLEMKIGEGKISIHISIADNNLYIYVGDDGLGMSQEKLDELNKEVEDDQIEESTTKHNGVAMTNIKKRLKLYWGDKAYMVTTSDLGYGTEVHLMMPLLFEKKDYMER